MAKLKPYWTVRGNFTLHNQLLLYGGRIVVLNQLQTETLQKWSPRDSAMSPQNSFFCWWSGISEDVEAFVQKCPECIQLALNPREPLLIMITPLPTHPWEWIISSLKSIFSCHGVPSVLMSDNGSKFDSSVMKEFANTYGFQHITSSPHYPQSNGLAERTVK